MAADLSKFGDIVEDFKKDSKKENEGVWMPFKRFEYKIARAHRDNVAFAKLMEERMRPFQWAIDRGNMTALKEVANDVLQVVYAATVLKGIRRVGTTESLAASEDDYIALFKQLPDLWDAVFKFAQGEENYSPDTVEQDSGN